MNKKTRAVLQELVKHAHRAYLGGAQHFGFHTAISAAEKLLDPPVRFAWARRPNADGSGSEYVADVASSQYRVARHFSMGTSGWYTRIDGVVAHTNISTLVAAKQYCVAHARTKQEAQS